MEPGQGAVNKRLNYLLTIWLQSFNHGLDRRKINDFQLENNNDCIVLKMITPQDVSNIIRKLASSRKAPGYDLITGQILKELPKKGIVKLIYLINAAFRLRYVPRQWKVAEVIMIPKLTWYFIK